MRVERCARVAAVLLGLAVVAGAGAAETDPATKLGLALTGEAGQAAEVSSALKILLALTLISLIPGLLVAMTAFTRIVIVLSMLRHALGMPETPPNVVVIGLALFLTLFTMLPVVHEINETAVAPYLADKLAIQDAARNAVVPLRDFMLRQTREQDLSVIVELAKAPPPATADDVRLAHLVPAFMLSELRTAFQIGFVIFLPFLLVDLVVSSVLMSMGMLMMPPIVISLPIKVMMFVLIDGWSLVVRSLAGSFH
jgi:flagellar biosynthetic protein FliP